MGKTCSAQPTEHEKYIFFAEDEFCRECGAPTVLRTRHECGRQLYSTDKFCPGCGQKVKKEPTNPVFEPSEVTWHD